MAGRPRSGESPAARRQRRAAIEDPQVVLDAALRFLEARSRSVAEVRRRLTDAGYRSDLVDGSIARLLDLGMLDDAAFATAWVESRDRARPRGERALRQELRLKGIAASTINGVLEVRRADRAALDADPDAGAAERLLERHARTLARLEDPRVRRQRAYAILARSGFDPSVARDVSRRAVARADDIDDDASE